MRFFSDLRRAVAGAAVGARLALGAERLSAMRRFYLWAGRVGLVLGGLYLLVMVLVAMGVL